MNSFRMHDPLGVPLCMVDFHFLSFADKLLAIAVLNALTSAEKDPEMLEIAYHEMGRRYLCLYTYKPPGREMSRLVFINSN